MLSVMNFKIISIEAKNTLTRFVTSNVRNEFLQSWEWGEFQKKIGNKIFRIGVIDNDELVGAVTIIKKKLPFGKSYFYAPRGPLFNYQLIYDFLFGELSKLAQKEGAIFFRFEPDSRFKIGSASTRARVKDLKFKIQKTNDVQPSQTIILGLSQKEEDLLKNMHSKTRYNIRLASKKGVKIIESSLDQFEEFWNLMKKTSERDGFRPHSKNHYKTMLQEKNKLFFAKYNDKIIAVAIINFFGNTATYLHGASSNEHRNIMAPYLLQWHIIKLAQKLGFKYYDFYGINEVKWPGVTRFKKGFEGQVVNYPGTFDLIINEKWSFIYNAMRKIKQYIT